MRPVRESDFVGKRIKSADVTAVNHIVLYCDDDTSIELWAETAISTGYGDISGIFIYDHNLKEKENDENYEE